MTVQEYQMVIQGWMSAVYAVVITAPVQTVLAHQMEQLILIPIVEMEYNVLEGIPIYPPVLRIVPVHGVAV